MKVIDDRNVWTLVPRTDGDKVIGCRWVYTLKTDDAGRAVRFKARLVAQGHRQIKGVNYDEVFSPVVNFTIIRLMFAIFVSKFKWEHLQLDITGAYLYAPLSARVLMSQPQGFINPDKPKHVCLLHKALYGLHQSGLEWYSEIHSTLIAMGYIKLISTNCVYTKNANTILLLYVDDIVIMGKTLAIVKESLKLLKQKFDIQTLGKTKRLLGVSFEQTENSLTLNQENYICEVYERFSKYPIPLVSLPLAPGVVFSRTQCPEHEEDIKEMEMIPYRSLIGCLSFVASRTRPDISYAVNVLSQFQANPGRVHWDHLLKVLGYLYSSRTFKLNLTCSDVKSALLYCDASFASCRDERKSTSGLILFIGGATVMWKTTKQNVVSISTMEAETYALSEGAKEAVWISRVIDECRRTKLMLLKTEFSLLSDNQSAIHFTQHPVENSRSRHIDVRYHYVRELVKKETVKLVFVRSKENFADILTKTLPKIGLNSFREKVFIVKYKN